MIIFLWVLFLFSKIFSLIRMLDEYETNTCKLTDIISLGLQRMGSDFIEWGSLACSSTGDTIALADAERHLYVTNFRHRASLGKKGENRYRCQLVVFLYI